VRPALEVLVPGGHTTVQDLGRLGRQRWGVPVGGAADTLALRLANRLVGNSDGAAGLECAWGGLQLRARADVWVALGGADCQATVGEEPLTPWQPARVARGQVLRLGPAGRGMRAYVAVAGGVDVPRVLGSRSTDLRGRFGGLEGRPLRPGDLIFVGVPEPASRRGGQGARPGSSTGGPPAAVRRWEEGVPRSGGSPAPPVRVVMGPQQDAFTAESLATFLQGTYAVGERADRMGLRLEGPRLDHLRSPDVVSDGVIPGAVQVPGDGLPIVLMPDCQTTGGYAKVACVISADRWRLGQLRPGDRLTFEAVSVAEARAARRELEAEVARVPAGGPAEPAPPGGRGPARWRVRVAGRWYLVTLEPED